MLLSHQVQVCMTYFLSQKSTTVKYYIIQPASGTRPYSNIILGYFLQYLCVFSTCLYSHVCLKYLKYYITDNEYEISYIL